MTIDSTFSGVTAVVLTNSIVSVNDVLKVLHLIHDSAVLVNHSSSYWSKSTSNIKLSICIPAYNKHLELDELLYSILKQKNDMD